jgi:hypothetical protein
MEHLLILAPNQSHDVGGEYAHVPQFLLLSFHLFVECLSLIVPPIVPPIVAPIVTLLVTTKVVVLILDLCFMLILLKLEFLRL